MCSVGSDPDGGELSLPPEALEDADLEAVDELGELDVLEAISAPPPPPTSTLFAETPAEPFRPVGAQSPSAWLERGGSYQAAFQSMGMAGAAARTSYGEGLASTLAQSGGKWIDQLWRTEDDRQFAHRAEQLEGAVRALAEEGELRALWSVARALYRAASDGGDRRAVARAAKANEVLRVFGDPTMLAHVATRVLADGAASEDGRRILLQAGLAGAYGLYGARLRMVGHAPARAVFVSFMKDFGIKAWPVIKAALEKLHASLRDPRAREVAEDLLLCLSSASVPSQDDTGGQLVLKFLRVDVSTVNKAATVAILKLWGERAKPVLFNLLQAKEDSVRLAAIAGLRQLGGLDERVVPRLQAILLGRVPAGDDLRVGAALALAHVTDAARQPALSLLRQILSAKEVAPSPTGREDAIALAAAQALAQHAAPGARAVIAERAARSRQPLRGQLEQILSRL